MDLGQLILRFLLGGSVVMFATLAADVSKNPYISGLLICFPSMLLAGALALVMAGYQSPFISNYFIGTLGGLVIVAIFVVLAAVLIKEVEIWMGMGIDLAIWTGLTTLTIFLLKTLNP